MLATCNAAEHVKHLVDVLHERERQFVLLHHVPVREARDLVGVAVHARPHKSAPDGHPTWCRRLVDLSAHGHMVGVVAIAGGAMLAVVVPLGVPSAQIARGAANRVFLPAGAVACVFVLVLVSEHHAQRVRFPKTRKRWIAQSASDAVHAIMLRLRLRLRCAAMPHGLALVGGVGLRGGTIDSRVVRLDGCCGGHVR